MLSYLAGRTSPSASNSAARKAPLNNQNSMKQPLSNDPPQNRPNPVFSESYPASLFFRGPQTSTSPPPLADPFPVGRQNGPPLDTRNTEITRSNARLRQRTGQPSPRVNGLCPLCPLCPPTPVKSSRRPPLTRPLPPDFRAPTQPPGKPFYWLVGNADVTTVTKSSRFVPPTSPNRNSPWLACGCLPAPHSHPLLEETGCAWPVAETMPACEPHY